MGLNKVSVCDESGVRTAWCKTQILCGLNVHRTKVVF